MGRKPHVYHDAVFRGLWHWDCPRCNGSGGFGWSWELVFDAAYRHAMASLHVKKKKRHDRKA